MTNLEQLAQLLKSLVHGPVNTHDPLTGACSECPYPLHALPPYELAQAIIDAGWTAPVQPTTPSYLDN